MSRITHACGSIGRSGKLLGSAALAFLLVLSAAHAQTTPGDPRGLHLVTLAPIPVSPDNTTGGAMYSFDISYVDQTVPNQTYYLADRSNRAVQVVDAVGNYVGRITATPPFAGFTGNNATSGPNGVVAAFPWLFVTDANSRVVSIDLRTNATVSTVQTGGAPGLRADELAYDPTHGLLLVVNNADDPPFATIVGVNKSTGQLSHGNRITFDAAHGVDAQNGAEQPVWDDALNRFFLSIPQIGPNVQNGAVIRINPFSATVDGTIPVNLCGPAGLTLGPNQNLFIGCNTVFDANGNVWDPNGGVPAAARDWVIKATNGTVVAAVFGVGAGDEVWYNPGNNNYYATGSGSPERPLPAATASGSTPAGVVDANDNALSQRFPTYNVAAVSTANATPGHPAHPAGTSHSIAANSNFNMVFVPIPANNALLSPDGTKSCLTGCVAVFSHADD